MEKRRYFKPEISICEAETSQMIARSGGTRVYPDEYADPKFQTFANEDLITDIWGNEF